MSRKPSRRANKVDTVTRSTPCIDWQEPCIDSLKQSMTQRSLADPLRRRLLDTRIGDFFLTVVLSRFEPVDEDCRLGPSDEHSHTLGEPRFASTLSHTISDDVPIP